ncbi:DUF397 domain-containing protein [Spirillospora sp. NPDC049652]
MSIPRAFPAASWRRSSHSSAEGQCVEVAGTSDGFAVRDSKDPEGPRLTLRPEVWDALSGALKATENDA